MHEEEVDVAGVVDEEDLVAGWSQVLGLLVATITDLCRRMLANALLSLYGLSVFCALQGFVS